MKPQRMKLQSTKLQSTKLQPTKLQHIKLQGYKFHKKIGEGGMATVYKGQQLSLARPVAIKILSQPMRQHDQVRQSFERESLIIARLNHPNIIQVIDRGVTDMDTPYFIMEYVDGVDLSYLMREGQLPLARKLEICLQICKALAYAHKNGVIHRDIKPANVIVDNEMHAKVLDFGIALLYQEDEENPEARGEDNVMGTASYMAPEAALSASSATFKSDLYSLGVILYELLTGCLPCRASQVNNNQAEIKSPSAFIPSIPKPLDDLVMSCLSPLPSKRPESAVAIHDKLLLLLRGSHLNAKQVARARESMDKKTFNLLDILSENDFSAVYLFAEKQSGRQLVVKKSIGSNTGRNTRCDTGYNTGKRLASLDHANIVKVHGVSKNPRASIVVMDYLRGGSLQDRLVQPYSITEFLMLARQVCEGLAYAHRNHIVHGNLRASNILFDDEGGVRLADFGLRSHYDNSRHDSSHHDNNTNDEKQPGSDAISRKHNWYSLPDEAATPALDIFASGVVFYQMLIGELPRWVDDRLQTGRAFRRLPKTLQQILTQMLERNAYDRIDNIHQVLPVLTELNDQMPTIVMSTSTRVAQPFDEGTHSNQNKLLLLLLLILFFIVSLNTGLIVLFQQGELVDFYAWIDHLLTTI